MTQSSKKLDKARAKHAKKAAKAELKVQKNGANPAPRSEGASPAVRYAESVRGVLYVLMGVTLVVALVLGHRGAIVSLDDVIDSLFAARMGKIVLGFIAIALVIYGSKHLRLIR